MVGVVLRFGGLGGEVGYSVCGRMGYVRRDLRLRRPAEAHYVVRRGQPALGISIWAIQCPLPAAP